jgi:hypothetical protein
MVIDPSMPDVLKRQVGEPLRSRRWRNLPAFHRREQGKQR